MIRQFLFPFAILPAVLAGAFARPASGDIAKVPDPRNSVVEPVLVGNMSGQAMASRGDPATTGAPGFLVVLRDVNNSPIMGYDIDVDFSGTSVRLSATQSPGTTLDCARRVLSKTSDLDGRAVFTPCFGGSADGHVVLVSVVGVGLAEVPARSTDLDGVDGMTGLGDLGRFSIAFTGEPGSHPEADFDASGGPIGLMDLLIFAQEFGLGVRAGYCP